MARHTGHDTIRDLTDSPTRGRDLDRRRETTLEILDRDALANGRHAMGEWPVLFGRLPAEGMVED